MPDDVKLSNRLRVAVERLLGVMPAFGEPLDPEINLISQAADELDALEARLLEANREVGFRDAQIDMLSETLTAFQRAVGTVQVPLLDPESHTPVHLKGAVLAGQTQAVVDVLFIDDAWWWTANPEEGSVRRRIPVTDHGTVEVYQRVGAPDPPEPLRHGTGPYVTCRKCGGKGRIGGNTSFQYDQEETCDRCHGNGNLVLPAPEHRCETCDGYGVDGRKAFGFLVDCRTCKGSGERTVEVFGVGISLDPDGLTGGPEAGS